MFSFSIKNFQSIKDASLKFRGFTTISGRSDIGKSAVRRALGVALFNEWDKSYLRNGEKTCELSFNSEDFSVNVIKGSGENSFNIKSRDESFHLAKVGKDQPIELANLGFKHFETSGDSYNLNITSQLRDPLFVVAYKDSENTKIFNSLFKIDKIEKAQSFCASDLRSEKMRLESNRKSIESDKLRVKEIESRLSILESFNSKVSSIRESLDILKSYLNCVDRIEGVLKRLENVEYSYRKVDDCVKLYNRAGLLEVFINKSSKLLDICGKTLPNLKRKVESVDLLESRINSLNSAIMIAERYVGLKDRNSEIKNRESELNLLLNRFSMIDQLHVLDRYSSLVSRIESICEEISILRGKIDSVELEIKDLNVCETCGRPL